jgi:hypothetical protein
VVEYLNFFALSIFDDSAVRKGKAVSQHFNIPPRPALVISVLQPFLFHNLSQHTAKQ